MAMPCVRFEVGTDIVILFKADPSSKDLINKRVIMLHGIRCLINGKQNNLFRISFSEKKKFLFFFIVTGLQIMLDHWMELLYCSEF